MFLKFAPIYLALGIVGLGVSASEPIVVERVANRYVLSDMQVVDVIGRKEQSDRAWTDTSFVRTGGEVYSIASRLDRKWGVWEFTISNRKTKMSMQIDIGFGENKLPVPITVLVGDNTYRMLGSLTDKLIEPGAKKQATEAVSTLPSKFLSGLRMIHRIAFDNPDAGLSLALGMLGEVIADPLAPLDVISETPLKANEVDQMRAAAVPGL